MEYLFIGGVGDGSRIEVDSGIDLIALPHQTKPALTPWVGGNVPNEKPEVDMYEKECLRTQTQKFFIFRHSEISVDDMFEKLIAGYRPGNR